LENVTATP
jgi:uncharacterized protein YegP (UPF0339 family)